MANFKVQAIHSSSWCALCVHVRIKNKAQISLHAIAIATAISIWRRYGAVAPRRTSLPIPGRCRWQGGTSVCSNKRTN